MNKEEVIILIESWISDRVTELAPNPFLKNIINRYIQNTLRPYYKYIDGFFRDGEFDKEMIEAVPLDGKHKFSIGDIDGRIDNGDILFDVMGATIKITKKDIEDLFKSLRQ